MVYCYFSVLTGVVKVVIFSMTLTFIIGIWNYFVIAQYISNQRLGYFNLWETNTHRRSSENIFSEKNLTVLHMPIHDTIMLAYLSFNGTNHLGNYLFKLASSYGIAKANDFTLLMCVSTTLQTVFENITFDIPCIVKGFTSNESYTKHVKEPYGYAVFHPKVFELRNKTKKSDVIKIGGYRQSWRYFTHTWKNDLKNRLKFSSSIQNKIYHYLHSVLSDKSSDSSLIGIHIRRGDFKSLADHGYTVSNITYIVNAIKYYEKRKKGIVFIIATKDQTWTKEHVLPLRNNILMSPFTSPFDEMCLLASCNDSIITGGSYGWRSAYLAGGSVVYDTTFPRPNTRIGERFKKEDYYPPNWVGL